MLEIAEPKGNVSQPPNIGGKQFVKGPAQGYFKLFDSILDQAHEIPSMSIPIFKMLAWSYPLMLICSEHEWELHKVYRATSDMLVCALKPYFMEYADGERPSDYPKVTQEQKERYTELAKKCRACGLTRLAIKGTQIGNLAGISITGGSTTFEPKDKSDHPFKTDNISFEDERNASVNVPIEFASEGLDVAKDNVYSKVNCEQESTCRELLELTFELRLLNFTDAIVLDRREIKPGDMDKNVKSYEGIAVVSRK